MSIIFDKKDHIGYITINRPEVMNCLNDAALDDLASVWGEFRDDGELRVAIVTGAGDKAFCTGGDLKELIPRITTGNLAITPGRLQAFLKDFSVFKPIIAAVNGACLAGGMELMQGTDIRLAAEDAVFGLPEPRWGLFPAAGSTVRLPRQIPYCQAMEMLLVGEPITAAQALSMGLINRVVPRAELMSAAKQLAERIAENSPLAVQAIKKSVLKCADMPEERAFLLETFYARDVFASADAKEGPQAFVKKRQPKFSSPVKDL